MDANSFRHLKNGGVAQPTNGATTLRRTFASRDLNRIHHGDSRELCKQLPEKFVDVTITSPPYFDLKDYGIPNQIGYGQDYDVYLEDLTNVFLEVHRATKDSGSLWIVVDTFRRGHEVLPLPFDLAAKLKAIGWFLRDIVIWKKERTVPWTHSGTTKKIFEYILVFSKTDGPFKYFPEKLRDRENLRKWWVKYPERYNPRGKSLEEIWEFDIPTQGSWGNEYVRHFCPLPEGLVGRIIELTTHRGHTVFDPFAGTGTVPAQAQFRGRSYIGFELNSSYIKIFKDYLKYELPKRATNTGRSHSGQAGQFASLVTDLRILKYGRLLHKTAKRVLPKTLAATIFARRTRRPPTLSHKICTASYFVHVPDCTMRQLQTVQRALARACAIKPLSKFGIQETVQVGRAKASLPAYLRAVSVFAYTATNSHKHRGKLTLKAALTSTFPVFSTIGLSVEEPDG
jgi:DNA modification methylase